MVKDFLVSLALDLILLFFPNIYGPNPGLYKKISCQIPEISHTKVQEVYQSVQIYPYEGPEGQPATLKHYVINSPLNLIGWDLPMQWQIQIYIKELIDTQLELKHIEESCSPWNSPIFVMKRNLTNGVS